MVQQAHLQLQLHRHLHQVGSQQMHPAGPLPLEQREQPRLAQLLVVVHHLPVSQHCMQEHCGR